MDMGPLQLWVRKNNNIMVPPPSMGQKCQMGNMGQNSEDQTVGLSLVDVHQPQTWKRTSAKKIAKLMQQTW